MSTIKTNTLTGTTSAGSIVVTGEGGSTTTNLQQGLAKCWVKLDGTALSGTGTSGVGDSFNLTSTTDNGTGNYTITMNNDMSSANYSTTASPNTDSTSSGYGLYGGMNNSHAAGSFVLISKRQDSPVDSNYFGAAAHGDLA